MQVPPLSQEDPLEKEMATHFCILALKIPWKKSLAGHNPKGHKDSTDTHTHHYSSSCQNKSRGFATVCYLVSDLWPPELPMACLVAGEVPSPLAGKLYLSPSTPVSKDLQSTKVACDEGLV